MKQVDVLGVSIDVVDRVDVLQQIDRWVQNSESALVNNVNAHALNLAYVDDEFRALLNASELVFCDGFGVQWAARWLGASLGERMTPPDWIDEFFEMCAARGIRLFWVGDTDDVLRDFNAEVRRRHPSLHVVGMHNGFFEFDGAAEETLFEEMRRVKPDVVLTAMGMPRQEKWAQRCREATGGGVYIATGALFRWYSGTERRAPQWMTDHGLEWAARLACAPGRHFKRYVLGLPLFFMRVLRQRFARGRKRHV